MDRFSSFALDVCGVVKSYGVTQVLNGVDLQIEQGSCLGFLGLNGAGKTTLISIIAGLISPDSGEVHVLGKKVTTASEASRFLVGVVMQDLVYDPFFTVKEALRIQSGYFGLRKNDQWVSEIIDCLGLSEKADVNLRRLSGGMKRRFLVAQALVHKPPVIVLDEPTAGVDIELRQSIWSFIERLNRSGHTILLTTHYLEEAERLCDRIVVLHEGRVLIQDTVRGLLARYSFCELEFTIVDGHLPSVLSERKFFCEASCKNHTRFRFKLENEGDFENILKLCWEGGCTLKNIRCHYPSLNDAFGRIICLSKKGPLR